MRIGTQAQGSITVLTPHGPLAADDVADFRGRLEQLVHQKNGRVIVDLEEVPFLDSIGIEMLADLCGISRPATLRPRLAQLGETCREALELTQVLPQLDVYDTVENALRSFKR